MNIFFCLYLRPGLYTRKPKDSIRSTQA